MDLLEPDFSQVVDAYLARQSKTLSTSVKEALFVLELLEERKSDVLLVRKMINEADVGRVFENLDLMERRRLEKVCRYAFSFRFQGICEYNRNQIFSLIWWGKERSKDVSNDLSEKDAYIEEIQLLQKEGMPGDLIERELLNHLWRDYSADQINRILSMFPTDHGYFLAFKKILFDRYDRKSPEVIEKVHFDLNRLDQRAQKKLKKYQEKQERKKKWKKWIRSLI